LALFAGHVRECDWIVCAEAAAGRAAQAARLSAAPKSIAAGIATWNRPGVAGFHILIEGTPDDNRYRRLA
jgi:hypothetical protein